MAVIVFSEAISNDYVFIQVTCMCCVPNWSFEFLFNFCLGCGCFAVETIPYFGYKVDNAFMASSMVHLILAYLKFSST